TGSRIRLVPVGAEVEAGPAKVIVEGWITHEIDGHAPRVGEQQHVAEPGNLTIKRFDAESCGVEKFIHCVAVLAQTAIRDDTCIPQDNRIELVLGNAAPPGFMNDSVAG